MIQLTMGMHGSQNHSTAQQSRVVLSAAGLKKFLKKNAEGDTLAVLDSKLGSIIKEKLDIPCIYRYSRNSPLLTTTNNDDAFHVDHGLFQQGR